MDLRQTYLDYVQKARTNRQDDTAIILLGLSGEVSRLSRAIGLENLSSDIVDDEIAASDAMKRIVGHLFLLCSRIGLDIEEVVSGVGDEKEV